MKKVLVPLALFAFCAVVPARADQSKNEVKARLDSSWIEHDSDSTKALYRKDFGNSELLTGKVPIPEEAKTFVAEVARVKTDAQTH